MVPMQILIFLFTLYFFVIGFCGMWRKKEVKIKTPRKTFALVVAAHNEHAVIEQLVLNLKQLNYPKDMYDIYVIADNCTDNTAEIAEKAGASRPGAHASDEEEQGLRAPVDVRPPVQDGQAVRCRLRLRRRQPRAPAVPHGDEQPPLQGRQGHPGLHGRQEPVRHVVSGTFAIAFWVICYISHLAKSNIGLSACLGGTGMCFDSEILKKHGWQATCLTEDMEFTMKCMAEGIKTSWAHDAIIYDEKPLTFKQSWNQRRRWAQGQFDVGNRFIPKMLKAGWKHKDIRMWDECIYLMQPHFLMISTIFIVISYIQLAFPPFYTNIYNFMPSQLMTAIMLGQYILPIIILIKIRAKWKSWLYMLLYPVFIYSWIPIIFLGFIHRNEHEWSHTQHTRAMSMNDIVGNVKNTKSIKKSE